MPELTFRPLVSAGEPLMRAALQQVWHAGVGQVALTVQPLNPARSLYGRCGFATTGPRNGYHHMLVHR
jgi:hypothetical protein